MASPADVAEYIEKMCAELAGMADRAGLRDLRFLLGMCMEEAKSRRLASRSSPEATKARLDKA
jgi:hypothetical protein